MKAAYDFSKGTRGKFIAGQPFQNYFRRQADVIVAYLFGSVARGQSTSMSDVDIAILLDHAANPELLLERQIALLTDLDPLVDLEVQLTLLNDAPPLLAYQVIRDGLLLHQRSPSERVAFQVTAMKQYFDIQPMLTFHNNALRRQLQEAGFGRRKPGGLRTLETAERIHQRLKGTSTG
jgi:uncharacterized protein